MTTPHHKYTKLEVELMVALARCNPRLDVSLQIELVARGVLEMLDDGGWSGYRWLHNKLAEIKKGVEDGKE